VCLMLLGRQAILSAGNMCAAQKMILWSKAGWVTLACFATSILSYSASASVYKRHMYNSIIMTILCVWQACIA